MHNITNMNPLSYICIICTTQFADADPTLSVRLFPVAGATPSSEVGSGGAVEQKQQPESDVVATAPEHGDSAQRPPLDNYAYCYRLKLDTVLRDYEIELAKATGQYESECQKEALQS